MPLSADQQKRLRGQLVVKNISGASLPLSMYGGYIFAIDEEIDLLDPLTPDVIRASNYAIAQTMVGRASVGVTPRFTSFELGACISVGDLAVVVDAAPDLSVILEPEES